MNFLSFDRIAQTISPVNNPLLLKSGASPEIELPAVVQVNAVLQRSLSTGKRTVSETVEQRRGTWLHALLQQLSERGSKIDQAALQKKNGIPAEEMDAILLQAQALLAHPELQRYFDAAHYLSAHNEMPYVNAQGELKRIDRLVEFDSEVWVLDYKTGASHDPAPYRAQMMEYRNAMQSVYADKAVRCALIFSDGMLSEM